MISSYPIYVSTECIYLHWQVLLLMASALKFPIPESTDVGVFSILASKLRTRQQNIAEITEMIHVSMAPDHQIQYVLFFISQADIYYRSRVFCMMMFWMMLTLGEVSLH